MIEIEAAEQSMDVVQRLTRIEDELASNMREVHHQLVRNEVVLQFFGDALQAYRDRCLRDVHADHRAVVAGKVRNDKQLGFPHRKIVDILLAQYDFSRRTFSEMQFSRLVSEARVGKNRAKGYLAVLEKNGYLERRDDGYRIFFKIRNQ